MLKHYMAYSRGGGPEEGAVLVLAHTVQEAKRIAWSSPTFLQDACDGDYLDLAVTLLKNRPWLDKDANQVKLHADIPHVIECPSSCKGCELWGYELNERGYCEDCAEDVETEDRAVQCG
jgi:hypothetical protein